VVILLLMPEGLFSIGGRLSGLLRGATRPREAAS
jgi:hypothetical protein